MAKDIVHLGKNSWEESIDFIFEKKINQFTIEWQDAWSFLLEEISQYLKQNDEEFFEHSDLRSIKNMRDYFGDSFSLKFFSFYACTLRIKKKYSDAQAVLINCESWIHKTSEDSRFYYYYECESLAWRLGKYFEAFDFGLMADQMAKHFYQKCWIQTDLLIISENLGLPQGKIYQAIGDLLELNKNSPHLFSVLQQMNTYEMRCNFRKGQFHKVYENHLSKKPGQDLFYQMWVAELPYQDKSHEVLRLKNNISQLSCLDPAFLNKNYRLRTLLGELSTEDEKNVVWSDWADRLYLWCWRWLLSPHQYSYQLVIHTLSLFSLEKRLSILTLEDRLMLRNVLGWISLFDVSSKKLLKSIRDKLYLGGHEDFPLLSFENQLINDWENERQLLHQRELELTGSLKIVLDEERNFLYQLSPSYQDGVKPQFQIFCHYLKSNLRKNVHEDHRECKIVVDLCFHIIWIHQNNKKIISEHLTRAIEIFSLNSEIRVESFYNYVFESHLYQEESHLRKVFDLIARLRNVLRESIFIQIRGKNIYSHLNVADFYFIQENEEYRGFVKSGLWSKILLDLSLFDDHSKSILTSFEDLKEYSWKEIANVLQKPRSTTLRYISKWLDEGKIMRQGSGKAIRYTFKEGAIPLIL